MRRLVILVLLIAGLVAAYPATVQASSPPTGQIAFVRDGDIWIMDADGSSQRRLWHDAQGRSATSPSWSPDGSELAFAVRSLDRKANAEMRIIDADGAKRLVVAASDLGGGDLLSVAWSPDGTRIAYVVDWAQVGAYDLDSRTATTFWSPDDSWTSINKVSWFPDARRLVCVSWIGPTGAGNQLLEVDAEPGAQSRPSEYQTATVSSAVWSPDGATLVMATSQEDWAGSPAQNWSRITTVRVDGSDRRDVVATPVTDTWPLDVELVQPCWSPGGDSIAYTRWLNGGAVSIGVVRSDGSGSKTLANNASDPAWTPLSPAPAPKVTLTLRGLTAGALTRGKLVTASGTVAPITLAGSKVTLSVQRKTGATWVKVKSTFASISPKGRYSWKYAPVASGTYRMRAQVVATAAYGAASTPWRAFRAK